MCRNLQTDNLHCGACDAACAAGTACSTGTCKTTCATGTIDCGGACINPNTSSTNCGATAGCGVSGVGSTGTACGSDEACFGGTCLPISLPVTSGLIARYSARNSASIVTATGGVTTWRDISGHGRDLAANVTSPAVIASCITLVPA